MCVLLTACSECPRDAASTPVPILQLLKWLLYWGVIPTVVLLGCLWELIVYGFRSAGWLGLLTTMVFLLALVFYNTLVIAIIVSQQC